MGRRTLWIGTVVVLLTTAGLAQTTKWSDPYEKALTAIKGKKWQEAVDNLNKAIAADPKAQADKYVEGTFSEDYFPYYYLGLAYENLGQPQKAFDNFVKAQQTKMTNPLMQALQQHMGEVQAAIAAQNQPSPPPIQPPVKPPTSNPEPPKAEPPKPPDVDPKFLSAQQQAEASLAAKKYAEAVQQFNGLKAMDPTEFAKRGLAAKADEATRGLAADAAGLVTQGNQLLAAGNLNEAETKFRSAVAISAQTPGAQAGLTEVSKARAANANLAVQQAAAARSRSQRLLQSGRDLAAQHKYAEADAQYQAAVDADKTNSEAVDQLENTRGYATLASEGKTLYVQGKLEEARAPLRDAQSLDSARFSDEGLDKTLADIDRRLARAVPPAPGAVSGGGNAPRTGADVATPTGTAGTNPAARPPLQDALVAYLKGDMNQAIQLLQPLAANDKAYDASGRALVHAYLGVAYATSSLEARTDRDSSVWRQKALSEFQLAQAAQPGYTLSQRIISPKIQAILDEARRSR